MNKYLKSVGSGMVWGAKHPFKDVTWTDRYDDDRKNLAETMCDALGVALVQQGISWLICIGGLIALGYASNKIKNLPVKANVVVDKEPKKK